MREPPASATKVSADEGIAHLVRLQGFALVSYRLRALHSWQGNQWFRVWSLYLWWGSACVRYFNSMLQQPSSVWGPKFRRLLTGSSVCHLKIRNRIMLQYSKIKWELWSFIVNPARLIGPRLAIDAGHWSTFLILDAEMRSVLLPINSVNNVMAPRLAKSASTSKHSEILNSGTLSLPLNWH